MPDRLSCLATAIRAQERPARPACAITNDNAGPAPRPRTPDAASFEVQWEGPRWEGPGDILALGMQDGRHRLGAVRAALAEDVGGSLAGDTATLQRLLAYYGIWLGFEGRARRVRAGKFRWLPVLVGPQGELPGKDRARAAGRVEYRLDLKRIARQAQRLTADATILLDGRPAATLDGLSIVFRPSRVQERAMPRAPGARVRPDAPRAR